MGTTTKASITRTRAARDATETARFGRHHNRRKGTGLLLPIDDVEAQGQRENHWLREIKESDFNCGLLICGDGHTLSLAFRFRAAGFRAEALSYFPIHKLCPRTHADSLG